MLFMTRGLAVLGPLVSCVTRYLAESNRAFELAGLSWQLRGMGQPFLDLPGLHFLICPMGTLAAKSQSHGEEGVGG